MPEAPESAQTTPDPLSVAVGSRLRAHREAKDLSMYRLSNDSGVDERGIAAIERGSRSVTITTLGRLCRVLEVPVSEVIREAEGEINP